MNCGKNFCGEINEEDIRFVEDLKKFNCRQNSMEFLIERLGLHERFVAKWIRDQGTGD